MKLIKKPTTVFFKALTNGYIKVFRNGQLYFENKISKNLFEVNLPFDGFYSFSGHGFEILSYNDLIFKQANITLPTPDRNNQFTLIKQVLIDATSSSPAKISINKDLIILSPKFYGYTQEVKLFIILHEIGHYQYIEEWKADRFAAYHFLKMGCNPSQAFESLAGVLHDSASNDERIQKIYNQLI